MRSWKLKKKTWVLLPQQNSMELHYFDARFLRWIGKKTINDAEAIFDQSKILFKKIKKHYKVLRKLN